MSDDCVHPIDIISTIAAKRNIPMFKAKAYKLKEAILEIFRNKSRNPFGFEKIRPNFSR